MPKLHVYDGHSWLEIEGSDGEDGRSAYQIAVDNGFIGTESSWLASLKGEKGEDGDPGDFHAIATTGSYSDLENVPSSFPPSSHNHDDAYAPVDHSHAYSSLTGLPTLFSGAYEDLTGAPAIPDALDDLDTTVTGTQLDGLKAKVDDIEAGAQVNVVPTWSSVTGKPGTFPPAPHDHDWAEITGKPETFPPATHNHDSSYASVSHSHDWDDITGKPSTFAPAAHSHAQSEITNLVSDLAGKASSSHTHTLTGSIAFALHGGGAAIEAGLESAVRMNFAGTFTGWDVYSAQSGSIICTVGKATHTAYPTFTAISGTAKPTLASTNKNQSSALTGWATAFSAGDVIRISVDSAVDVEDVFISLRYSRTV